VTARRRGLALAVPVALVLLGAPAAPASGDDASPITGVAIDTAAGRIRLAPVDPAAVAAVVDGLPENMRGLAQVAAISLGVAIQLTRDQARQGSRPIPPGVRRLLAPYFPPEAFARVRWNVADPSRLSLEGVMTINKDVDAITLDDVVVFPSCEMGFTRWDLWSHELVHVLQYAQMGIAHFAEVYVGTAGAALENQAYGWQDYVNRRVRDSGAAPGTGGNPPLPAPCR